MQRTDRAAYESTAQHAPCCSTLLQTKSTVPVSRLGRHSQVDQIMQLRSEIGAHLAQIRGRETEKAAAIADIQVQGQVQGQVQVGGAGTDAPSRLLTIPREATSSRAAR